MRSVHLQRKPISVYLIISLMVLLIAWAGQRPAAAATAGDRDETVSRGGDEGTGFIEMEDNAPQAGKKKFPWLIVGAAAVVGIAAVYFLVIKKPKYTLAVSLAGASGTPASTASYKKGTVVNYSYSALGGHVNLEVRLDGNVAPATGTVTMNGDHTLTVTAVEGSVIQVNSTPANAAIFIDNADSGFTTPHGFSFPGAVTKSVLVRQCGFRDHAQTVSAAVGQLVTIDAALVPGIREDFNAPAASCWKPGAPEFWSTTSGVYRFSGTASHLQYNRFDHLFSGDFSVKVRLRRVKGENFSNSLLLSTTSNPESCSGYIFQFAYADEGTRRGRWNILKYNGCSLTDMSQGTYDTIRYWSLCNAANNPLGQWNELKVVRRGAQYAYYVNGVLEYSFVNGAYAPRCLVLVFYTGNKNAQLEYDYVDLSITTGGEPAPAFPFAPMAAADAGLDPLTGERSR